MRELDRDEMIDWLVIDDIDTIREGLFNNDVSYLSDILVFGKAYQDWNDGALQAEIYERELNNKE